MIVKDYRESMFAAGFKESDLSMIGLETWASYSIFAEALRRTGRNLTRANLINMLETMPPFDVGRLLVKFSGNDHYNHSKVRFFEIKNGRPQSIPE